MAEMTPDLYREIVALGDILRSRFSQPEFISGCEVISVADKSQYATNNGWIEAICGQHNQQRVRWKSNDTVIVGNFVDVLYFPDRRLFEAYGLGGGTAITGGRWPYDHIVTVSSTNSNATYSSLATALSSVAANTLILLDAETYTGQFTVATANIGLGCFGSKQALLTTATDDSTTLTISASDVTIFNLQITNTGAGTTCNCIKKSALHRMTLENCVISKVNGVPTNANGVKIESGSTNENLILYCTIVVNSGTNTYGVHADTAASDTIIEGGEIHGLTANVRTNHASAEIVLRTPVLKTASVVSMADAAAGTIRGWFFDDSGRLRPVSGSGRTNGVWLEDISIGFKTHYSTLTTALSAAEDGDTVRHEAGTSTGTFTIADQISLNGSGLDKTIITNTADTTDTVLTVSDTNVNISNLTISQTGAGGGGISHTCLTNGSAGLVVDNVEIDKTGGAATTCIGFSSTAGDTLLRNTKISVSAGTLINYAIYLVTASSTVVIEGGEITAGQLVTAHASAILELRGVKLASGVMFDTSGGGIIKGWYLDANNRVIILNGSHVVMPSFVNGDFRIWQRGTSFAAVADGTRVADNWRYNKVGAAVHTVSQSSDVPTVAQAGRKLNYAMLVDCTTVDAAIAAGDYVYVRTCLEGFDWIDHAQVGFPFSFWHKHTKTGTYCVAFRNSGADRSYVAEYTQAVTDTWELATVWVEPSPTAGTWDYTTAVGLEVRFALACGSTFQTTAGAWQTGDFFGTSNQVNACDSTSNNFLLALVGNVPDSSYEDKLARCRRLLWVLPGGNTLNMNMGARSSTAQVWAIIDWPVSMRVAPALTHNVSAWNNGSPTGTQMAAVNFVTGGFVTITGALTLALNDSSVTQGWLLASAATSFDGTAGDFTLVRFGSSVNLIFSAEL